MSTDPEIKRVLKNAYRILGVKTYGARPVWVFVRDLSACGSWTAREVCKQFEWDADALCKDELK